MKTFIHLIKPALVLILLSSLISFKPKPLDDGYYAIIVVDGIWAERTGYHSQIIFYPGYEHCKRLNDYDFFDKSRRVFSDHLKLNYNSTFPYGELSNSKVIKQKLNSSERLKSREEAEKRLSEWVSEQKSQNYQVVATSFSFNCDNIK